MMFDGRRSVMTILAVTGAAGLTAVAGSGGAMAGTRTAVALKLQWLLADLGFQTSGDPPAQIGIRLHASNGLAEIVDLTGRSELPGGTRGREATGYFIAGRDGKSAEDAAGTMVRDMLLYALKTEIKTET